MQRVLEAKSRLALSSATETGTPQSSQTAPVGVRTGAFAAGFGTSVSAGGVFVGPAEGSEIGVVAAGAGASPVMGSGFGPGCADPA